jgi:membrane fusion protein, multidrug efflux system
VKAAEATLQTARLNLDYTEVRAPVDGRAGRIEVTVGNLVSAGTSSPVLTSLVSVNPIYASFDADEDVVLQALRSVAEPSGKRGKLDQIPVEMTTTDGSTGKGHIQLIDNLVNGQSGTIRVRAVFSNDDGRLIPGQFARLRMGQPQKQTLVMVDEKAIGTDQDKKFVMVIGVDNRAAYRSVTLGGAVDGLRIVTSGLSSGDRIVINGLQRVRPGALVKSEVAEVGARSTQQAAADSVQHLTQR